MTVAGFIALLLGISVVFGKEILQKSYSDKKRASRIQEKIADPLINDYNIVRAFFTKIRR